MSETLRLACDGCSVGGWTVPAFRLCTGAAICLHMPGRLDAPARQALVEVLTGKRPLPGVQRFGRVLYAEPATSPTTFLGLLRQGRLTPPRPAEWLQRVAGLSPTASSAVVERLGLRPQWRLSQLAMNPRTLLGLEAVWVQGADAVVFQTAGCDPSGVRRAFEAVVGHLIECCAIYLSFEFWQEDSIQRSHLPGATCLEITQATGVSSPLAPIDSGS